MLSWLIKIPINLLATAFWFVWGGLIQIRMITIKIPIYAGQVALAPYFQKPPPPDLGLERIFGLWWHGFSAIWSNLYSQPREGDAWEPSNETIWGALGRFLIESLLNVLFYTPIVLLLHYGGIWQVDTITSLERRLNLAIAPAGIEAETNTECLGLRATNRLSPPRSYVATEAVNIRQGPGIRHRRLGRLQAGQEVQVIGTSPGERWLLITLDGETRCFVSADYLRPAQ